MKWNEWKKCIDFKCVRKPTNSRLSLTSCKQIQPLSRIKTLNGPIVRRISPVSPNVQTPNCAAAPRQYKRLSPHWTRLFNSLRYFTHSRPVMFTVGEKVRNLSSIVDHCRRVWRTLVSKRSNIIGNVKCALAAPVIAMRVLPKFDVHVVPPIQLWAAEERLRFRSLNNVRRKFA